MTEVNIKINANLYKAIEKEAKKHGITVDALVTQAILNEININKKKLFKTDKDADFDKKLEESLKKTRKS